MVRQAHHERNQKVTVHPELVEGFNQRFPSCSVFLKYVVQRRGLENVVGPLFELFQGGIVQASLGGFAYQAEAACQKSIKHGDLAFELAEQGVEAFIRYPRTHFPCAGGEFAPLAEVVCRQGWADLLGY